jgi:hypothetical protein
MRSFCMVQPSTLLGWRGTRCGGSCGLGIGTRIVAACSITERWLTLGPPSPLPAAQSDRRNAACPIYRPQPPEPEADDEPLTTEVAIALRDIRWRRDVVMSGLEVFLIAAIVALSVLVAAGPTLVGLFKVLPSLVLAVGLAAALLRVVWFVTSRRSS